MARKKKEQLEKEKSAGEVAMDPTDPIAEEAAKSDMIDTSIPLVDPAPVLPKPPPPPPRMSAEDEAAMQPKRYRVVRGGKIMHRGTITFLKANKVIADNQYDVENLKLQGCTFEEVS